MTIIKTQPRYNIKKEFIKQTKWLKGIKLCSCISGTKRERIKEWLKADCGTYLDIDYFFSEWLFDDGNLRDIEFWTNKK